MPTPAFADFVAPARRHPELWRLFLGLLLFALVYIACVIAIFGTIFLVAGAEAARDWMLRVSSADGPGATLILLTSFLGMALGTVAAARVLHKRGLASLIGPAHRAARDFVIAGGIVAVVLGASLILWRISYTPEPGLAPGVWLMLLPLALVGILIQTGAEELLFRGYLQQQLAARFRSPLAWLLLPALLFGLVHFDPGSAGQNAWIVVAAAAVFGLAAADLTAVTGNLGAAWGFHFVNNTYALLVIATKGTIPGLALYLTPYAADDAEVFTRLVIGDLAVMAIAWLAIRRTLRR